MKWLDRYVGAVKRYLPKTIREDVGEEIRSLLQDKLDEAQDEQDEALGDAEVLQQLKDFGHPLEVASRYREQRVLIGETLFPVYKQAVKYLLLFLATLYAVSTLIEVAGVFEWWPSEFNNNLFTVGVAWILIATLAFHLLDSHLAKIDFFARWNPKKLPPVQEQPWANMPLSSSIAALAAGLVCFSVLSVLNNEYSLAILLGQSEHVAATLILWLKVAALLSLSVHGISIYQPYWTRLKLALNVLGDIFIALFALKILLLGAFAGEVIEVSGEEALLERVNLWISIHAAGFLLIVVGLTLFNLRRAVILKTT